MTPSKEILELSKRTYITSANLESGKDYKQFAPPRLINILGKIGGICMCAFDFVKP